MKHNYTKLLLISLLLFLLYPNNSHAQISIAAARALGVGSTVTVKGLVLNGAELGPIRYIQDETGGLGIYSPSIANNIARYDSATFTGTLIDFQTLLEMSPVNSYTVLSSNNTAPVPNVISPSQMNETNEGTLVKIPSVTFALGGGTFSGNTTYTFSTSNETGIIYVRTGSPLVGTIIPTATVDLIGIVSQYQNTYQLLPRDANDIISSASINITSAVSVSNIQQQGFTLQWNTDVQGSTGVLYGLTPSLELGQLTNLEFSTLHTLSLTSLQPGEIYYVQAFSVASLDTAFSAVRPYATASLSSGDIKVYFNCSLDNSVSSGTDAQLLYKSIDDTLIAYINRAEQTLDLTIYDFDNSNISNISQAINDAYNRGVRVRFISDGSLTPTNYGINDLLPQIQHITSPTTSEYNIMHNKFVIIDAHHTNPLKPIVWTGSTNWTDRQINRDPNSVVIIQDQSLALSYELEFEEMWGSSSALPNTNNSKFGPFKTDNTPHEFAIGGRRIECYFSPSDATNNQLLRTMNDAQQQLFFASMLITRSDLENKLEERLMAGVDVKGVIDDSLSTTQYSALMASLGADRITVNNDTNIIMHHKYMLIDPQFINSDPTVWISSHNWTNSANNRNDENTLVIHDPLITNLYYQEFMARFANQPADTAQAPDLEAPSIVCPPDTSISINAPDNFISLTIAPPVVADNNGIASVYNSITGTEVLNALFFVGTNTIDFIVTDLAGNTANCSTTVTIVQIADNENPTIECPQDITIQVPQGETGASVSIPLPIADDNIGISYVENDYTGGLDASSSYPLGTTTITWTAVDLSGNASQCSTLVTVEVVGSVEAENSINASISPNVVASGDILRIQFQDASPVRMHIYSNDGRRIQSAQTNGGYQTVLALNPNIASGLYIITFESLNNAHSQSSLRFVVK